MRKQFMSEQMLYTVRQAQIIRKPHNASHFSKLGFAEVCRKKKDVQQLAPKNAKSNSLNSDSFPPLRVVDVTVARSHSQLGATKSDT
jgi:hypothetical protein